MIRYFYTAIVRLSLKKNGKKYQKAGKTTLKK